ncbi:hypothetical protein [Pseudomonas pergaminensis]|uniref:hypothetical protein n=1 Tax=Pseudomonas pergaminensis TaxID=2853159 RepID=UPI0012BA2617
MAKDDAYSGLSYSTCFAGAVGSLLTYVVSKYPQDVFWGGVLYVIPPITLVVYTITDFGEARVREWWASRTEKADVDFILKECDSILKDQSVTNSDKEEALATRNLARMSVMKNKAERLKKHAVPASHIQNQAVKRNNSAKAKVLPEKSNTAIR